MLHADHALAVPAPWWHLVCFHPPEHLKVQVWSQSSNPAAREKGNVYQNQPRSCTTPLFPIAAWTSLLLLLRKAKGQPFLCPWHWDAVQGPSLRSGLGLLARQALQTVCTEAGSWKGTLLVWEGIEEFWLATLASCVVLCCFFEHRMGFGLGWWRSCGTALFWAGSGWWDDDGLGSCASPVNVLGSCCGGALAHLGPAYLSPMGLFNPGHQQRLACAIQWAQGLCSTSCLTSVSAGVGSSEFIAYCCETEACCRGWRSSPSCVTVLLSNAGWSTLLCVQKPWAYFSTGFLCSSSKIPEWLNVSQRTGLMVATQPRDLCNPRVVQAAEIVVFILFHQGLLWAVPWEFSGSIRVPAAL